MRKALLIAGLLFHCCSGLGQQSQFISYYSNNTPALSGMDQSIRLINVGSLGTPLTSPVGDICASVYVFDDAQHMVSCCAYRLTPNELKTLGVGDLTSNSVTSVAPANGTITIATMPAGASCGPTKSLSTADTSLAVAAASHIQLPDGSPYITETSVASANLAPAEASFLPLACTFIHYLGSGTGVCGADQPPDPPYVGDPPTISCTAPDSLWHTNNVAVSCTAAASLGNTLTNAGDVSFVLTTNVPDGVETALAVTNTRQVCDVNGNCATAGPFTFKIDRKPPNVSCGSTDLLWHSNNVSVSCTSADGGSGLLNAADSTIVLHTSVAAGSENANALTDSRIVCDTAGNCTSAGPFTFKIDRNPPTVSCASADLLWHSGNVSLPCTSSDTGSGLLNAADSSIVLQTSVADGSETANALTDSRIVCDAAGNCASAGPFTFKIDRKPPTVACASADLLWHSDNVSLACTSGDGGSGLANPADLSIVLQTSVAPGTENANAPTDSRTVCDNVGNCSPAGPAVGNKIDRLAPAIAITVPSPGATYILHDTVAAQFFCSDGGSGIATCLANANPVNTAAVGTASATVNAADVAGNIAQGSVAYNIAYNICLLYDPTKSVKSGHVVSIKFFLCDSAALDVSSPSVVVHASAVSQVSSIASPDVINSDALATDTDFRFDATLGSSGGYIYNFKATGLASGTYSLAFTAGSDPTTHYAYFQVN